jgi:hypothetical protein
LEVDQRQVGVGAPGDQPQALLGQPLGQGPGGVHDPGRVHAEPILQPVSVQDPRHASLPDPPDQPQDGIDLGDSLSINPHKWLGTVFDVSMFFVKDPDGLQSVMSSNPSYLRTHTATDVTQFRDWGIPLGRRFRALKLWFVLRAFGAVPAQFLYYTF